MTINDLIRTTSDMDEFIIICAGSLRKRDVIYDDTIRRVPERLKDAIVRNWKTDYVSQCLRVEIDPSYATVMERYNRKLRIK